jgi:hypothetical protein
MDIPIETLEAELLRLPAEERSRLLDRVVASLEQDADLDQRWDRVAAQREAEAAQDPTQWLAAEEVVTQLRSRLA